MTTNAIVPSPSRKPRGRILAVAAGVLLASLGGVAGAQTPPPAPPAPVAGMAPPAPPAGTAGQPQVAMLITPMAIAKLQPADVVAVKGSVAEIYGNKFILEDDSGRILVDLGPRGDDRAVVTKGEQVSVQGRFDRGFVAAQVLSRADGRSEAFGPPPPPPPSPEADRGPGRRPPLQPVAPR